MNVFNEIDNYFEAKTKKDFFYSLILIVAVIGFLIYYFVYPNISKYYEEKQNKFNELSSKLQQLNVSINVLKARVSILDKQIKEKNKLLNSLNKKIMFYNELYNLLDFAEFDEYKWSNVVKEMVVDANKKGLSVIDITNRVYDVNISKKNSLPRIVKRMDIGISLEGDYKNFIYYIYDYENRKDLIRIEDMNISSPTKFYVKFSIYGYDR